MTLAIFQLGNGVLQLSHRRRDVLKNGINPKYQGLYHHSQPVTNHLFGNDVASSLKELNEMSKVARSVAKAIPKPFLKQSRGYHKTQKPINYQSSSQQSWFELRYSQKSSNFSAKPKDKQ